MFYAIVLMRFYVEQARAEEWADDQAGFAKALVGLSWLGRLNSQKNPYAEVH